MAKLVYTPEYWSRAIELIDVQVHRCEYCKRPHDERRGEFYCFVRLIDIGEKPGDLQNLVLACRRCRPGPRGPKLTKKQILDKIAELPFDQPVAGQGARA